MALMQRTTNCVQNVLLKSSRVCSMVSKVTILPTNNVRSRTYATAPKKTTKISGGSSGGKIKEFPVETDVYRLQEYCCGSNILQEGEDIKLKPENEYPDWLFTLHTGPPKELEEMDPNSKEYWEKVRKIARQKKNQLHKFRVKVMKQF